MLKIEYVLASGQVADTLTNALPRKLYHQFLSKLGAYDLYAPACGGVLDNMMENDVKVHAYDQHLNMILGDVEEVITTVEIDDETYEEIVRASPHKVQLGEKRKQRKLSLFFGCPAQRPLHRKAASFLLLVSLVGTRLRRLAPLASPTTLPLLPLVRTMPSSVRDPIPSICRVPTCLPRLDPTFDSLHLSLYQQHSATHNFLPSSLGHYISLQLDPSFKIHFQQSLYSYACGSGIEARRWNIEWCDNDAKTVVGRARVAACGAWNEVCEADVVRRCQIVQKQQRQCAGACEWSRRGLVERNEIRCDHTNWRCEDSSRGTKFNG
ncbi:hypothetical protein KSP39_PZI004606 [Platanthera zijinensis]|uniref:LSM domain-containing protein n=1 Tax=Platanthera zijinensis TaxID=2320716 RepID=A0AAP0BXT6_9ASPA